MTLGQRIYTLRTQAGMSQEDLAEKTGVSRQSVSKWETDASIPELDKLIQLSKVFDTTLDALVQDAPTEPAPQTNTPPVEISRPGAGFFTPARIVGLILFAAALLGILLSLIFFGDFTVLILAICGYLLLCGILCVSVRKHPGLAVAVATLICVLVTVFAFAALSFKRMEVAETDNVDTSVSTEIEADP